jgi:hypothetical protein
MRGSVNLAGVLAVCLGCGGCVDDSYEVKVEITPQTVRRSVTVQPRFVRSSPEWRETERAALATAYSNATIEDQAVAASGEFAGPLPDDIGTLAQAGRFKSDLGELIIYLERVRGTDDWVAIRQRELEAADAITDVVVAWAREEFKDKAGSAELLAFLDGPARRDVQNLGYLATMFLKEDGNRRGVPEEEPTHPLWSDFMAKALAYLAFRQYLSLGDASIWEEVYAPQGHAFAISHAVLSMMRRRLHADHNRDAALLLEPAEALTKSFLAYTHDHPELALAWFEKHTGELPEERPPDEREYDVSIAFEGLVYHAIGLLPVRRDELKLLLDHGGHVLATNGEITAAGRIEWEYRIAGDRGTSMFRSATPLALIVRPDHQRQISTLGHTISEDDLARYCLARATLTPELQSRWDALVEKHGKELDALESAGEELGLHWSVRGQLVGTLRAPD